MNEDNNNQNDQPTEEEQPPDETQPILREISKDELKQILEDHKKWLESDGKEGEQANLSKANLSDSYLKNAELSKANFEKANLSNANFKHASLREANFRKANCDETNFKYAKLNDAKLQKVNLDGARLQKANFFRANLQKADLSKANLQKTFLNRADLQKAEIYNADLHKATLLRANLQKAILSGSNLHKANLGKTNMQSTELDGIEGLNESELQYANLEGAKGLLGNEFAQADVTGTKLPDDIKEFRALEIVKETSQNARKIFFAMLLGCVYSWLTIATTTDVRLLTNTASSPLPIIGTEIPIAWFYITAPLVLICLYFYFHLYLDNLWGALSSLPAIFPDGKRLDERAYPWLLNTLVRKHFKRLKSRPLIARMKEWITIFLAWWVVPITMMGFWLRYIPRRDWYGTGFHVGLIVISVAFAIIFYRICLLTLQGQKAKKAIKKSLRNIKRLILGTCIIFIGIIFLLLSYGAIEGVRIWSYEKYDNIQKVVPVALKKLGYNVFAEFKQKRVSEVPENYGLIAENERLEFVEGANLRKRNLNYAIMQGAFLANVNLIESNLKYANLQDTDLRNAKLRSADLQNANLIGANLKYANFEDAKLQKAHLWMADLKNADLRRADLKYADLKEAKLQNAELQLSKLQGANFEKAKLQNAKLRGANLKNANLMNADLTGTYIQNANFEKAMLYNSFFRQTDLTGAKNLTIDQLSKVKTLYQAKLDPELMEQVKKCCPHLLEKPKEETDQKEDTEYSCCNCGFLNLKELQMEQVKKSCPHLLEKPKEETDQKEDTEYSCCNCGFLNLKELQMEQVKKSCPHLLEKPKEETDQKEDTEYSCCNCGFLNLKKLQMEQVKKCCPYLFEKRNEETYEKTEQTQ